MHHVRELKVCFIFPQPTSKLSARGRPGHVFAWGARLQTANLYPLRRIATLSAIPCTPRTDPRLRRGGATENASSPPAVALATVVAFVCEPVRGGRR